MKLLKLLLLTVLFAPNMLWSQALVINEFLTSNKNIVTDPAGDYDDCVELYNLTNDTINMIGYYLSDDDGFASKWPFPDTFILPNNFLVIWCDDEILEEGLHTNFRLSSEDEELILTSPFLTVVDEIDYPEQSANVSYGRYPDGTGDWRYMYPTIGYGNLKVSVNESLSTDIFTIYPNPANSYLNLLVNEPSVISIYNNQYQQVYSAQINTNKTIDINEFSSGLYWVEYRGIVKKLLVR